MSVAIGGGVFGPGGPGLVVALGPSERVKCAGVGAPAGQGTRRRVADPPGPTSPRGGPRGRRHPDQRSAVAQALDHPPAPPPCPLRARPKVPRQEGVCKMSEFIAGVYRQRIQAVVEVGGDVRVDITAHGGGRGAAGSYITAVFGVQVMVTMFDLAAARAYVRGWLDPADEWVFEKLPQMAEASVFARPEVRGPGVTVRAHGADDPRVQFDQPGRS